jgi:precorrin-3B methylase
MMKLLIAFVASGIVGVFAVHAAFAQTSTSTPTVTTTTTVTPTVSPAVKADTTGAPAGAPKTGYGTMSVR